MLEIGFAKLFFCNFKYKRLKINKMSHVICYLSTVNSNTSMLEMIDLFEFIEWRNYELGLTGILVHSGGNFFQILEGEKKVVKSLFAKISKDKRHYNIVKIIDSEGYSPLFEEYSFEFLVVNNNRKKQFLAKVFDEEVSPSFKYETIAYLTKEFVGSAII